VLLAGGPQHSGCTDPTQATRLAAQTPPPHPCLPQLLGSSACACLGPRHRCVQGLHQLQGLDGGAIQHHALPHAVHRHLQGVETESCVNIVQPCQPLPARAAGMRRQAPWPEVAQRGGGRGRGRRRGAPLQRTSSVPLLCGGNQGRWYSGRHQAAVALVPPARTCRLPGTTLSPLSLARWCSSAPATGHSRRTYQSQSCVMVAQGRQLLLCTARSWLPQEQGVARCWCASWPAHATGGATSSMWTHAVHICRHANGGATTSAHRQRRMPSSGICAGCCWWRPEPCDLQDMVGAA